MSFEPGERRRRRELERARELAAQREAAGAEPAAQHDPAQQPGAGGQHQPERPGATFQPRSQHGAAPETPAPSSSPAPAPARAPWSGPAPAPASASDRPMTRRQLREMREREAAARAAGAVWPGGAPAAQPQQQPTQPAQPAQATQPAAAPAPTSSPRPVPQSTSPYLSRRELRQSAPVEPPPPGAPVRQTAVRPPSVGAVRGLDATGGLGQVRPTTPPTAVVPQVPAAEDSPSGAPHGQPAPGQHGRDGPQQHPAGQPEHVDLPAQGQHPPAPRQPHHPGVPTQAQRPTAAQRPAGPAGAVAPGVPVPPIVRDREPGPTFPPGGTGQPAQFVPARPEEAPAAGQPGAGPWRGPAQQAPHDSPELLAPGARPQARPQWQPAPSPETGWTPAVSGAVRRPVEPGTLPPGVIAPVPVTPPAGTFVPTGATPNVAGRVGVGTMPRTANAAPVERWGSTATDEDTAGAPPWQRVGVPTEEPEADEDEAVHGYTWLHVIILSLGAFVAGVLVWLLLLQGRVDRGPDALATEPPGNLAAQPTVVVDHPGDL